MPSRLRPAAIVTAKQSNMIAGFYHKLQGGTAAAKVSSGYAWNQFRQALLSVLSLRRLANIQ